MHFILPDLAVPSGGNVYDRRICAGLPTLRDIVVPPGALAEVLAGIPDGDVVLLDGLVACGVPEVVVPHADRLRLAVLVHLPLADETGLDPMRAAELDAAERRVLHAVSAVIATSPAAAKKLVSHHGLREVHTVVPGTDPAPLTPGTDGVSQLLCVASLTPRKGHDLLIEALSTIAEPWHLTCVGPGQARFRHDQVTCTGPLTGAALDSAYAAADLFVLASRAETYGMVITEALARGIPVIASSVPDALGDGGLLTEPEHIGAALRQWFTDADLRADLRRRSLKRRGELSTWDRSTEDMAKVLASLRP